MAARKVTAYLTPIPLETVIHPLDTAQSHLVNMTTMVGLMSEWGERIEVALRKGEVDKAKDLAANTYRIGWIAMEEIARIQDVLGAGEDEVRQHVELRTLEIA